MLYTDNREKTWLSQRKLLFFWRTRSKRNLWVSPLGGSSNLEPKITDLLFDIRIAPDGYYGSHNLVLYPLEVNCFIAKYHNNTKVWAAPFPQLQKIFPNMEIISVLSRWKFDPGAKWICTRALLWHLSRIWLPIWRSLSLAVPRYSRSNFLFSIFLLILCRG